MTCLTDPTLAPAPNLAAAGFTDRLRRLWRDAPALARQRRALARLDDRLLRDIGIDPAQARSEAGRPVWDAPRHWRT